MNVQSMAGKYVSPLPIEATARDQGTPVPGLWLLDRLAADYLVVMSLASDPVLGWRQLHVAGAFERDAPLWADSTGADVETRPNAWAAPLAELLSEHDLVRVVAAVGSSASQTNAWSSLVALRPVGDSPSVPAQTTVSFNQDGGGLATCLVQVRRLFVSEVVAPNAIAPRQLLEFVESACELGIIEYEPDAELIHLDGPAARLHHVSLGEKSTSLPLQLWTSLFVADDQLSAYTALHRAITPGTTERLTVRLPVEGAPRKPHLLELSVQPPRHPHGPVLVACRDVTRERSLEDLRRQKLAAERASQAKSQFMSHVSHELRTPLHAILGFAQMMAIDRANPLPPDHLTRLEVVRHSGQRLLSLIDQLLQITKIESGKRTFRLRDVNVQAVVRHCVSALQPMADAAGVRVTIDVENPDTSAVHADAGALEQAISNLLSNAIKYNRRDGEVHLIYRAAGELGELAVVDTGSGMTDSQRGRMYEPFDRLGADRSPIPGVGLGLCITKQLIEAMKGTIHLQSEVGVGSTFTLHLPASSAGHVDTAALDFDPPSQWQTGMEHAVLYIEDDDVNLILMEQLFSIQPEWRLHCVSTGVDGITAAVRLRPSLILLDMNLPDMNGVEVFRRLRQDARTRDIPVIAVSADALPEHVEGVKKLGFDGYWTKPLDLVLTIDKLKQFLSSSRRN